MTVTGRPDRGGTSAVSRRAFLELSTLTAAEAGLVAFSATITEAKAETAPLESVENLVDVTLVVNGVEHKLKVEPRMTLAETLRGPLRLTGTKISCNRGACSACTVHVGGVAVCSCSMLAVDVGGRPVTTIEGLANGEALDPVQEAFIAHDAMQCGFCTPGMTMAVASLLERTPDPTRDDVRAAIAGHICRCGTYPNVVDAALAAAKARRS